MGYSVSLVQTNMPGMSRLFPARRGDAYSWLLPETIELCAIQLPNRGAELIRYTDSSQIIAEVAQSLLSHMREGQKLVFHGYCVGPCGVWSCSLSARTCWRATRSFYCCRLYGTT